MTDQSPCTVVEAVRQDLLDRSRVGQSKYGTTLGNAGLSQREILQHAYEEALDLANYLKTEIMRLDAEIQGSKVYETFTQKFSEGLVRADWKEAQKATKPVACEDVPIDTQSPQEMGWTKVGNMGWRKGKVSINVTWQPFNRRDMILVNDGNQSYYALDLDDAFKMGERLL